MSLPRHDLSPPGTTVGSVDPWERSTYVDKLIANVAGSVPSWSSAYMSRTTAAEELRLMTGQNLGQDARAWRGWFDKLARLSPVRAETSEDITGE